MENTQAFSKRTLSTKEWKCPSSCLSNWMPIWSKFGCQLRNYFTFAGCTLRQRVWIFKYWVLEVESTTQQNQKKNQVVWARYFAVLDFWIWSSELRKPALNPLNQQESSSISGQEQTVSLEVNQWNHWEVNPNSDHWWSFCQIKITKFSQSEFRRAIHRSNKLMNRREGVSWKMASIWLVRFTCSGGESA